MKNKELKNIEEEVKTCTRCELFHNRSNPVSGSFSEHKPSLLFVSGAPGPMEDLSGKPFINTLAPRFTQNIYDILELTREQYSITYCIKCMPFIKNNSKETVKRSYLFWCSEYLYRQIEELNPSLVISMGRIPFSVFLLRKNNFFTINEDLRSKIPDLIGYPYEFESILSNKKYLLFSTYDYNAWINKYIYEKSIRHLKQIKEILHDIKAGKDRQYILRNSPILK
jgi:uracil-DNA glycosylase family 4